MATRRSIRTGGLLAALLLLAAGCGGSEPPGDAGARPGEIPLAATRHHIDAHRWLGTPVVVDNLVVWPVHTDAPLDLGEFLTLQEAEARGLAVVKEVGGGGDVQGANGVVNGAPPAANEPEEPQVEQLAQQELAQVIGGGGAQVNTLVVANRADLPILVCAGTIVKGGQQDRQIGQDFVIAAHSEVAVDAFCVEPGRWSLRENGTAAFFASGQGVAVKAVRASAQYEKDQGKVWAEVREVLNDTGVQGTDTLVAAREQATEEAAARREEIRRRVLAHFESLRASEFPPVGFAYAVNGKPVTVRAFAHPRLLEGHLGSFVQAMCLEAELAAAAGDAASAGPPPSAAADVIALVRSINAAEQKLEQTRAANVNGYRVAEAGFNGACYLADEEGGASERNTVTVDWTAR